MLYITIKVTKITNSMVLDLRGIGKSTSNLFLHIQIQNVSNCYI